MMAEDGQSGLTEISASVAYDGRTYIALISEMAAIDTRLLQLPLGDLRDHEDAIRRALDRLFTGF